MATDKKNDKERSVEERLQNLFKLQTYLSKIDAIKIQRGELPNEVKDLEDELIRYQTRIQKHKEEIENLKAFVVKKKGEIEERKEKIARYEEQIDNVRNNREFAFLEKEKEFEGLEIELAEKNIREANEKQEQKAAEIVRAEEGLADTTHILEEKKKELDDIVNETRLEEENIRGKVKELEGKIDDYTLAAFKRIRKNARNGLGIVTVQREACGGCFNRIPPQRRLEIKMHKKVIVCEYCGRIMVDGALVGVAQPEVEAPVKPKRKLSKSSSKD
ncbi:MAG: hypothetical protein K2J48_10015 [Muribaculaceae bacterium]|nr:hypothetical protein [Muribaculaceae bacterium]MDE6009055.1 hypothetical protein [Muribaculaceae bacterium]MDE6793403.1 hypothetical protein [Muribaculaceae bacterium]